MGNYEAGALGDDRTSLIGKQSSPVQTVTRGNAWASCAAGRWNSAAVKTDGTLWVWGSGASGQLATTIDGWPDLSSPVQTVAGGTDWKSVSCSDWETTAAIKLDGTLWMWGHNSSGQLGDGTAVDKSSPVQTVAGGTDWSEVDVGSYHTAAIKTDGTLWMWGTNTDGQLGIGDIVTITSLSSPVQTIAGGTNWKQVSVGDRSTAAVKTDGTLWTWGRNTDGQLGNDTIESTSTPVQTVAGGTTWTQVSMGTAAAAAVKTDGTLWLWGSNFYGTLGTGDTVSTSSPVQTIAGGTDWSQVSIGDLSAAAIKTDGSLWTWGGNWSGMLGNGSTAHTSSPVQTAAGGNNWRQVSVGTNHMIAVKTDDSLWVWGDDGLGVLGTFFQRYQLAPYRTVDGDDAWTQITGGLNVTAGIKTDGTLWTWGSNGNGSVGDGTTIDRSSPVQTVLAGTNWRAVSATFADRVAAVKTDGTLWMWGSNPYGQLGNGNVVNASEPMQTVAGGTDWYSPSCGSSHTAAIKTDGSLWMWGDNSYGQLGTEATISTSSPVQTVAGGTDWRQVSCGFWHTAAIKTDGTLWAWGYNTQGQLCTGDYNHRSSPVQVVGSGVDYYWRQVSAGMGVTLGVGKDNTLWGWGANTNYLLGADVGSEGVTYTYPINLTRDAIGIIGYGCWRSVSCGKDHVAAVKTDGTAWAWGSDAYGQCGIPANRNVLERDGTAATKRSLPTQITVDGTAKQAVATGGGNTFILKDIFVHGAQHTAGTIPHPSHRLEQLFIKKWAIEQLGSLWGFGSNLTYQLGTFSDRSVEVSGGNSVKRLLFSGVTHDWQSVTASSGSTLAIKIDGTLWGWGYNLRGELGRGHNSTHMPTPAETVSGGNNWKTVSMGVDGNHVVALKTDGSLWTWGYNNSGGQLGAGAVGSQSSPIQTVAGGTDWVCGSAGYTHTVAVKSDGSLWTWGGNIGGQLGDNTTVNKSSPIQTITGGATWRSASAGTSFTGATKSDGTLWMWGINSAGQLADGTTTHRSSPVQTIAGGTNWKQISCGFGQAAAIKTDGTLWVWGVGGDLGTGDTISRSSPVQTIAAGTLWRDVSVGKAMFTATRVDGTLWVNDWATDGLVQVPGANWRHAAAGDVFFVATKDAPVV